MTPQPCRVADPIALASTPHLVECSVDDVVVQLCRPASAPAARATGYAACRTAFSKLDAAAAAGAVLPLISAQLTAPTEASSGYSDAALTRLLAALWFSHDRALAVRETALAVVAALDKADIAVAAVRDLARLFAAHPDVVERVAALGLALVRAGWARLHDVRPDLVPATAAPGPCLQTAADSSAPPAHRREAALTGPAIGAASRPTPARHGPPSRRRTETASS